MALPPWLASGHTRLRTPAACAAKGLRYAAQAPRKLFAPRGSAYMCSKRYAGSPRLDTNYRLASRGPIGVGHARGVEGKTHSPLPIQQNTAAQPADPPIQNIDRCARGGQRLVPRANQ